MQKESFWDAKGVLLECKRSPFVNGECRMLSTTIINRGDTER